MSDPLLLSDRFEERRTAIEATLSDPDSDYYIPNEGRRTHFAEDRDEHPSHNVFWVSVEARWQYIQDRATLSSIVHDIEAAMDLIGEGEPNHPGRAPPQLRRSRMAVGTSLADFRRSTSSSRRCSRC